MLSLKMVKGTSDLVAKIDTFKWEVEKHGPLDMPDVEVLIENSCKKALQIQRLLDRMEGPDPKPLDQKFETAKDNLYDVTDWFAAKEKELREIFEPYLRITQQRH